MNFIGELIKISDLEQGTSKSGSNWKRQQIVVLIDGKYPQHGVFTLFNETTSKLKYFKEGEMVSVSFDMNGREYNSKWYADLKCWNIERYLDNAAKPEEKTQMEEPFTKDFPSDLPF